MEKLKSVLVIHLSSIGDVVSGFVVVQYLRDKFNIDFLTTKVCQGFLDDETINLVDIKDVAKKKYDFLIDLSSSKESIKIARSVKAKIKICRVKNIITKIKFRLKFLYDVFVDNARYNNIVKDYYPVLEYFGYLENNIFPSIKKCSVDIKTKKIIGIHVGANNPKRILPEQLVIDVIDYCRENNIEVVLFGSEREIGEAILKKTEFYPIFPYLDGRGLKNMLSCLDYFIGSDSGILHLASAMNISCLGIYGPNLSSISGPINANVEIVEKKFDCRPCDQGKECIYDRRCLDEITSEEIIKILNQKL